jgi:hypothetical protein
MSLSAFDDIPDYTSGIFADGANGCIRRLHNLHIETELSRSGLRILGNIPGINKPEGVL